MLDNIKNGLATVFVGALAIGGIALVANLVHADDCPADQAAVGLCSNGGNTSTTSTTVAQTSSSVASAPSTTVPATTSTTVAPTTSSTQAPASSTTSSTTPGVSLTKDAVSALCSPKCDTNNLSVIEQGGGIHYDGPAVSVKFPSGYCMIDTTTGRVNGPADFQGVSQFTVRLCPNGSTASGSSTSGGNGASSSNSTTSSSSSGTTATTQAPPAPAAPVPTGLQACNVYGAGWSVMSPVAWFSDGSLKTPCIVPQGMHADTPGGRVGPGTVIVPNQVTMYNIP